MTDEPEREKTIEQHARNVMSAAVVPIRVRVLVDNLLSLLSASEKRADKNAADQGEMYRLLDEERLHIPYCSASREAKVGAEGAGCSCPLGRTIRDLHNQLSIAIVVANNYQSLMVTAQRERDEARAETMRLRREAVLLLQGFANAENERDEARMAGREVLNYAGLSEFLDDQHAHGSSVWGIRKDDLLRLRSALHRSQG